MLVQLLLCIGLPVVILPTLTAIGYFGFRYLKSRRNARTDVETGDCIKMSTRKSSSSESGNKESKYVMTPALVTNSVQVPASVVVRS
jgi:flagellar basal body-associated protein FliL